MVRQLFTFLMLCASLFSHAQTTDIYDPVTLRSRINSQIIPNNNKEITGAILNKILNGMLNIRQNYGNGLNINPTYPYSVRLGGTLTNHTNISGLGTYDFTLSGLRRFYLNIGSDSTGDMYYRNAQGYWSRIPMGGNGHSLVLKNNVPTWAPVVGADSGSVISLARQTGFPTVADMMAAGDKFRQANGVYQTFTQGWHFPGDGGGGIFRRNDTCTAIKDTLIHYPGGSGCWELQVSGPVKALQIGMRANSSYVGGFGQDNSRIFEKLKATSHYHLDLSSTGTYSFSSGAMTANAFYFSDSIKPNKRMIITGAGRNSTMIIAPKGVYIGYDNTELSRLSIINNWGQGSPGFNSSTAHGVFVRSNGNRFSDVRVTGFPGDGFNVESGVNINCNNNSWDYCDAWFNGRFGFYAKGADANSLSINNGYWDFNARVGIHYSGFLGIKLTSTHSSSNGHAHPLNKSIVMHGGQAYAAIQDNKNYPPDSTGASAYWQAVNIAPIFYTTWNRNDSFYWGGVAYAITDANPRSGLDNLYFENDQVPLIDVSGRAEVNNGELSNYAKQFLRVESGRLTTNELQVIKPNGDRLLMTPTAGNADNTGFIGTESGAGVRFGFDFKNLDWIKLGSWANSDDGANFLLSPGASAYWNNLFLGTSGPANGSHATVLFRNGLHIGVDGSFPGIRLTYGSAAPTSGWHRAGERFLYVGPDSTIDYFQCWADGIPGQWRTVYKILPAKNSNLIVSKGDDSSTTTGAAQNLNLRSVAGKLANDGDVIEAFYHFNASASGQTAKVFLDGQELCSYTSTSTENLQFRINIIRTGSNSVRCLYSVGSATDQKGYTDLTGINFSTALMAATGTAPSGTMTLNGVTIDHKPLNQ